MRRIFVVEDDKFITAIFTMFLRDLGHELVGKTSSGREAVEMCKELHPDVVLMDIHLDGELDGIQTAEVLRREVNVPVIYISSDTSSQVIERAIVTNSYGYLVKPINKKELGISIDLAFYKHKVDVEQREREQGYREFISTSPLPIVVVTNGKIMYLNCLGLDVFKTHYIEDVIGFPIADYIHEDFIEEFNSKINSSLEEDKKIEPFLIKLKTVHGDTYWAELTGSKVNFNNKISVQIIVKDVSQSKFCEKRNKVYEKILFDKDKLSIIINNAGQILKTNTYTQKELDDFSIEGKNIQHFLAEKSKWYDALSNEVSMKELNNRIEIDFANGKSYKFQCNLLSSSTGEIHEVILLEE